MLTSAWPAAAASDRELAPAGADEVGPSKPVAEPAGRRVLSTRDPQRKTGALYGH